MDDTRRSCPADPGAVAPLRAALARALAAQRLGGCRVAIALSGGRDSVALLDAAAAVASAANVTLVACHVHHGLSVHADAWADFCVRAASAAGVPLDVRRVALPRAPAEGIEAAARTARYAALAAMAHARGARAVLLAHHQDDQAETLMLQLLRGSGPRGLAAMPTAHVEGDLAWLRPWLDVPRAAIERYLAALGLEYVDDDSNADPRYRRNALRSAVVPALRTLAPGYPQTVARAAAHQAEAAGLLDELAALDAAAFYDGRTLARSALQALSPARARNLLRWFLHARGLPAPSAARLDALLTQLCEARADASVRLRHAGREIGLYRERIHAHALSPATFEAPWTGRAPLALPHGELRVVDAPGGDTDLARLFAAGVTVRSRHGGERLRPGPDRPSRALKNMLREAALAPWERAAVPLVFAAGALAVVPGVAVDAAYQPQPGTEGGRLVWSPAPDH